MDQLAALDEDCAVVKAKALVIILLGPAAGADQVDRGQEAVENLHIQRCSRHRSGADTRTSATTAATTDSCLAQWKLFPQAVSLLTMQRANMSAANWGLRQSAASPRQYREQADQRIHTNAESYLLAGPEGLRLQDGWRWHTAIPLLQRQSILVMRMTEQHWPTMQRIKQQSIAVR